ncbi:MAG: helix-turn-helix transcriptional regulator [Labilithrix sp.]|nr:helix-turn-helix transcriptional regulator [Labilithrix sp.]MBX3215999.1 helix-turn-helix transcriptional regulator [Labilithrix sp.]
MPIVVRLGVVLAERNVRSKQLAEYVGITEANLSLLKQGKVKGVRFETLARICEYLDCQPGDLLEHVPDGDKKRRPLRRAS